MTRRWTAILILLACSVSSGPTFVARAHSRGIRQCHSRPLRGGFILDSANKMRNQPGRQRLGGRKLPAGLWGGEHISLQVTKDGGTIEYDCAHGTIPGGISVDRRGRFVVAGTHVEERGGPVSALGSPNSYLVQFSGTVSGKRMKVAVKRSDTKKLIGTFTLFDGQEASLVKCR